MKAEGVVVWGAGVMIGLLVVGSGCRADSDCDPKLFAEACLSKTRRRTCDSVRHWLPEPYVTWNVKDYNCRAGDECVASQDAQHASCVIIKPELCPPDFEGRACFDGHAFQCDATTPGVRWLLGDCFGNQVCNADFINYPACVSPSMSVADDPAFAEWLQSQR